jgi:rhamnosyltransferase
MVGTMYDSEILNYLRQHASGYIHGHSVGGTNPGLLEAMSATDVNLLFDVVFNKEVGDNAAVYFNNVETLAEMIDLISKMSLKERKILGQKAKKRMKDKYSWNFIVDEYQRIFYKPFEKGQKHDKFKIV